MVFAQIKDGFIKNVIILNDESLHDLFVEGFDHLVRVDDLSPQPGIGWLYDGNVFSKAPIEE